VFQPTMNRINARSITVWSTFHGCIKYTVVTALSQILFFEKFNALNVELNPICHLLALLRAHHILHVSRMRVNKGMSKYLLSNSWKMVMETTFSDPKGAAFFQCVLGWRSMQMATHPSPLRLRMNSALYRIFPYALLAWCKGHNGYVSE